jgi:HNH endonuclease
MIRLFVDRRRLVGFAHRLVWQHAHGDIPKEMQINHIDGNKSDNRLSNLELVTASGNLKHAFAMGLSKPRRGEGSNWAKFTDATVAALRADRRAGVSVRELQRKYGCSEAHVYRLINGERRTEGPNR